MEVKLDRGDVGTEKFPCYYHFYLVPRCYMHYWFKQDSDREEAMKPEQLEENTQINGRSYLNQSWMKLFESVLIRVSSWWLIKYTIKGD